MERATYSEQPKRITYLQHDDGSAEVRLRKHIVEDGDQWTALEVFIPRTFLSAEEIERQFDSYFIEEPEVTIADLTKAIDILTNIVLGEV